MEFDIYELIEELKKEKYTEIEKARKAYIAIGKKLAYDELFIYAMDYRYEDEAYNRYLDINQINNFKSKIKVTCKQGAEVLVEVLNKVGVKARNIGYEKDKMNHISAVVEIGDKKYVLSITKDFANIQKGFRTHYFAQETEMDGSEEKFDTLTDAELEAIDLKNGDLKYGIYMDDVIKLLKKDFLNDENFKEFVKGVNPDLNISTLKREQIIKYKLNCIFNYITNHIDKNDKMESYETYKFYRILISELLTKEEKTDENGRKRYKFDFIPDKYDAFKVQLLFKMKLENENICYEYSDKEKKFVEKIDENNKLSDKNILEK